MMKTTAVLLKKKPKKFPAGLALLHERGDLNMYQDGEKIARRGYADTPEAGKWVALKPGIAVTDGPDLSYIQVESVAFPVPYETLLVSAYAHTVRSVEDWFRTLTHVTAEGDVLGHDSRVEHLAHKAAKVEALEAFRKTYVETYQREAFEWASGEGYKVPLPKSPAMDRMNEFQRARDKPGFAN